MHEVDQPGMGRAANEEAGELIADLWQKLRERRCGEDVEADGPLGCALLGRVMLQGTVFNG